MAKVEVVHPFVKLGNGGCHLQVRNMNIFSLLVTFDVWITLLFTCVIPLSSIKLHERSNVDKLHMALEDMAWANLKK